MIASLHIENIAVVRSLDAELLGGLCVLTGETGAGKSIIIDSLGLLLGSRADRELIRTGESRALVSAVFSELSDSVVRAFSELGFDVEDRTVMLSRTVTPASSSARINGRGVPLSVLREAAALLVSIHGQNDSIQLLDPKNHIGLLDAYAHIGDTVKSYSELYEQILRKRAEIDALDRDAREQYRMREVFRAQIEEIDSARLKKGEEEALSELVVRLRNAEKISKSIALTEKAIRGGEKGMGAMYLVERAAGALEAISDAIPSAEELARRLREVGYELEDIAECASDICDMGDGDPTARLDKAEGRLDTIERLKRKYGDSIEEILAYREDTARRLDLIENAGERREDMENELSELCGQAGVIADELHEKRKAAAESLQKNITETLCFLDMPKVRFEVGVRGTRELCANGKDEVEFLIAANVGEPLMPMHKIASGGELARIMLALKNVLNETDGIGTVIFDEIDTGISGKTSRKVGIKLREIGRGAQVICVTHSAQIASLADTHLYISKKEIDGRVETGLRTLTYEERIDEVARILGGIDITETQRQAAREMIAEGESY